MTIIRNERRAVDCITGAELKKGEGILVEANLIHYNEDGEILNPPRKGQKAYTKSLDMAYIALSAQRALGGKVKFTKTETKKSGMAHYVTTDFITSDYKVIYEMITKWLFYPVKWNKKEILAWSSVYFYDANKTAQQLNKMANEYGIGYSITSRDMLTGEESPIDISDGWSEPKKIQHAIADARNAHKTWKASLHTA